MPSSLLTLYYRADGARAVIDGALTRLPRGWAQALDQQADLYMQQLVIRTPVARSGGPGAMPGRLRAGWRWRGSGSGAQAIREIYNIEPFLAAVLRGRPAIDQRALGRHKPMRFYGFDGGVVYRWSVSAAPANPFHLAAYAAARRRSVDLVRASVRTIMGFSG